MRENKRLQQGQRQDLLGADMEMWAVRTFWGLTWRRGQSGLSAQGPKAQ